MTTKTIAIMGANSHLAKSLIECFSRSNRHNDLRLFTRRAKLTCDFLASIIPSNNHGQTWQIIEGYETFPTGQYDAIINCIGIGPLSKHQGDYAQYFTVYEYFDNMAIAYLKDHPAARFVSLGSGAVYGSDFKAPANEFSINTLIVNAVPPENYYSLSRLYAEAKHRAHAQLAITDFRIFSFFSRFHDPEDAYLIDQIITAIRNKTPLLTNHGDFYRDYLHPTDLYNAIESVIFSKQAINGALDLCSTKPILKSEMLAFFTEHYGLGVSYTDQVTDQSATGHKNHYFSTYSAANQLNFTSSFSSKYTIAEASKYLLSA